MFICVERFDKLVVKWEFKLEPENTRKQNPYERLEEVVPYIIAYQQLKYERADTTKLSSEIQRYLEQFDSGSLFRLIITKVEPYIRNYPQLAFRKTNEDLKSDFFVYIYERFEGILEKFDNNLGKFSIYLSIKLKNYFLNYIRRAKVMNKIKSINYEIDTASEAIFKDSYNLELNVSEREIYVEEKSREKSLLDNLKREPFRYLCIKLYFFDLFTEKDFSMLMSYLKVNEQTISIVKKNIDALSEEVHRKRLVKIYYENCLNKTHYQNMLRSESLRDLKLVNRDKGTIKELVEKHESISKRRSALLQKYYAVNIFPSMKAIACVLQTEATKVSNIINYYKQYLNKKDFTQF